MRNPSLRRAAVGFGEGVDDLDGFDGDADDLTDEADDVFGVVGEVGVGGDAAALVGGDLVLVDDPIEGGAVGLGLEGGVVVFDGFVSGLDLRPSRHG